MKTFIDQILEDDRSVDDLDNFLNEFGENPMDRHIGEAVGLTDEETPKWGGILTNRGMHAAIEALKPIVEQKRKERKEFLQKLDKSARVELKIKQAQQAIQKIII